MSLSDVIRDFDAWTREQKLVERTMESCLQCLQNYAADAARFDGKNPDEVEGQPISDFVLKLEKQSLTIHGANHDYPYIETRLGLYLPGPEIKHQVYSGLRYIGYYRLIVKADGEVDDDYLVFEEDFFENANQPESE